MGSTAAILMVAGSVGAFPAAAQTASAAPDTLPALPANGFGVAPPAAPSTTAGAQVPPAPSLRLPPPGIGVTPLQQNEPAAPAILIRPFASVTETLTDNARLAAAPRTADAITRLAPGLSISADTPRLQGVLGGTFEYDKYAIATDQDHQFVNLYGNGTLTAIPDTLFTDVQAGTTVTSRLGAGGFTPVSQLPATGLTQIYSASVSPYLRKSYDGLIDGELRYRLSTINTGGVGTTPVISPTLQSATTLASSITNEGTLALATGRDFQRLLSRLTIDASQTDSSSAIANTRLTAYDDVEYRITSSFAALGRIGYENINYPAVPAASVNGPAWQIGARLDFGGADNDYAIVRYGKQEGIYGFSGSLRYQITPATAVTAEASQNLSSQQGQIADTLAQSSLDTTTGSLVDQYNLPSALVSPDFALQNDVYRARRFRVNLTTDVGPNHFALFGTYERRTSLIAAAPPSTSIGANFSWTRDMRPNLTGIFSVGYNNVQNLSLISTTASLTAVSVINNSDAVTADLRLNYLFNESLTGSIDYNFLYQTNAPGFSGSQITNIGNVIANQLSFTITKTF